MGTLFSMDKDQQDVVESIGEYIERELVYIFSNEPEESIDFYNPKDQVFKNYDFIFSGCSQTHGDHISKPLVPYGDYTKVWGFQMADKMKIDTINLGMGGDSAYLIVQKLINYFSLYGNPKTLACLMPDFFRFQFPPSSGMVNIKESNNTKIIKKSFHRSNDIASKTPEFSKKPHIVEHVIPQVWTIYYNSQAILMLEQYCKSNNIKFVWGTWHKESEFIIKKMNTLFNDLKQKNLYNNFVETECEKWNNFAVQPQTGSHLGCHEELKQSSPKIFSIGADGMHMGTHRHAHISEIFMKALNDIKN